MCLLLIKNKSFNERGDKEWIYQSLAQAYLGLNREIELEKIIPEINKLSKGNFDLATFNEQNKKLIEMMAIFKKVHGDIHNHN